MAGRRETLKRRVKLQGLTPIMFDRYPGDNKTELMPEQKMYFGKDGGLIIPSANLLSFLCAVNTRSAVRMFYDSKVSGAFAQAVLSAVLVEPFDIPLMRDGEQIEFTEFGENGINLHRAVARVKKGIPNPKERPVVELPWDVEFDMTLFPSDEVDETAVRLLFEKGGTAIGLGTYRGVYGKFEVAEWK